MERGLGVSLVAGGRAFWRDAVGGVQCGTRDDFASAASLGTISRETHVFDTTVNRLGDWRTKFEVPAAESWDAARDRLARAAAGAG